MNDAKTPPSNESAGNFFEDFKLGQEIVHATPRTVTVGDVSLFTALYGSRFAVQSSDAFAQSIGYPTAPIDDMLTFHIVLGKTVPDISRNAIANLGYADMRFLKAVYPAVWGIAQVATGPLSDRLGRKGLIVAGMWVQAAGLLMTAFGDAFGWWLGGSFLLGIGTAMVYPSLIAAVSDASIAVSLRYWTTDTNFLKAKLDMTSQALARLTQDGVRFPPAAFAPTAESEAEEDDAPPPPIDSQRGRPLHQL